MERKLTTILAADVVGYSRLMGEDEAGTWVALKAHRRELIDPKIAEHNGRMVKTTGDAALVEFPSVVEAVHCAVEIQSGMADRQVGVPENRRMRFRIGINLGDVIVDGDDIYGDGVNVAARLEQLSLPGGICFSRNVFDQVRDKLALDYEYLGEQSVKNIARPIKVYRVHGPAARAVQPSAWLVPGSRAMRRAAWPAAFMLLAMGAAAIWFMHSRSVTPTPAALVLPSQTTDPAAASTADPSRDRPSIAVLPFTNMSGDPEQEYFSDGMTEDLITDLSKVSGLLVIARNSTFVYKGRSVNVPQVGNELGARYIVEGSVRKIGDRVRITAQLIDAATGQHAWAERYDRPFKDIFDLQDEVREKIVAALAVKLTTSEKARLAQRPTDSLEAYDYWARALQQLSFFTREGVQEARRLLLQAIKLDPMFARAHGQIANTFSIEVEMEWSTDPARTMAMSVEFGERAVALDDALPQARQVLSRAYVWHRQHDRALEQIERAIALDPNFADGQAFYGQLLILVGRAEQAIGRVEHAMRINPVYPFWYLNVLGHAQLMLTQYDATVATLKKALERNPNWYPSRRLLVAAYGHLGLRADADWEIAELQAAGFDLSLSELRETLPYRDTGYRDRLLDGLRKAGVSE